VRRIIFPPQTRSDRIMMVTASKRAAIVFALLSLVRSAHADFSHVIKQHESLDIRDLKGSKSSKKALAMKMKKKKPRPLPSGQKLDKKCATEYMKYVKDESYKIDGRLLKKCKKRYEKKDGTEFDRYAYIAIDHWLEGGSRETMPVTDENMQGWVDGINTRYMSSPGTKKYRVTWYVSRVQYCTVHLLNSYLGLEIYSNF